jgi:hypothetical protein
LRRVIVGEYTAGLLINFDRLKVEIRRITADA